MDAIVRLYDRLFLSENPDEKDDYIQNLNPESCKILTKSKCEPSLKTPKKLTYQFERNGYFVLDPIQSIHFVQIDRSTSSAFSGLVHILILSIFYRIQDSNFVYNHLFHQDSQIRIIGHKVLQSHPQRVEMRPIEWYPLPFYLSLIHISEPTRPY